MRAGLAYPDGRYANADTGMWLHHVVMYNLNRTDTTCPEGPQRAFASGNERSDVDLTMGGAINTGYYVGAEDTFSFGLELMNEVTEARDAVLTIEWGYLPSRPQDFRPVTIVWLDVHGGNGCVKNGSDLLSPDGTATFSTEMPNPWTMTSSGRVVVAAGHLHDSGVDMQTMKNGEVVCDSVAGYGESAGFVDAKMMHISSMSKCDTLTVREGDKWSVKANYNFENHSPMMEGLTPAPVMGIAMLYIAP